MGRTAPSRIGFEKLADVPRSRQWSGFCFAVSDDRGDDQVGIVEGSATGVRKHVAEFASFMDRARRFGRAVTADAAGKGKLLEELPQSLGVFALVGINLRVGSLQVDRTENARSAMPRSGQKDHIEVVFLNQPVQVNVSK